mmetsp:Transcript_29093/g.32310  ORF Transcript_29093/g.32310 Transcript_29093/m.32310 type:complete len:225 (+) Transcript_29093:393-1067(+)
MANLPQSMLLQAKSLLLATFHVLSHYANVFHAWPKSQLHSNVQFNLLSNLIKPKPLQRLLMPLTTTLCLLSEVTVALQVFSVLIQSAAKFPLLALTTTHSMPSRFCSKSVKKKSACVLKPKNKSSLKKDGYTKRKSFVWRENVKNNAVNWLESKPKTKPVQRLKQNALLMKKPDFWRFKRSVKLQRKHSAENLRFSSLSLQRHQNLKAYGERWLEKSMEHHGLT